MLSAVALVTLPMRYSSRNHGRDLGIEDLPGALPGLPEHFPAVAGIGVVAKVRALVHETPSVGVDHDAQRIGVLLEIVADVEVAELRRVEIPADRMATRIVAPRRGTDGDRHADAVTGVVAGAPHLGQSPSRVQGNGLATPDSPRTPRRRAPPHPPARVVRFDAVAHAHVEPVGGPFECRGTGTEAHVYAGLVGDGAQRIHESRTTAPSLDRDAAPEANLAVDFEGLATVQRQETHPLVPHPAQRLEARVDEPFRQFRIGPVLRDPAEIVVEALAAVAAEISPFDLVLADRSGMSRLRSSTPEYTVRMAPAVNRVLPPRSAWGARSSTVTSAPASRAAMAALSAALPAPITATWVKPDSRVRRRSADYRDGHPLETPSGTTRV